ncbi:hypothetical protein ACF1GW_07130 [Streptomyces achromogenes]|uniref:hypothetical protein n=1 Tax=Streptomyces achromogenes TaxID=67255 RepID=UPI0036F9DB3A
MAKPAAAANTHAVNLEGFVSAFDYEPTGGHTEIRRFNETILVSHSAPVQSYSIEVCSGNEAVARLTVKLNLRSNETVRVTPNIKLWEFNDCNHSDLEESVTQSTTTVRPGEQWTLRLSAHSHEYQSPDNAQAAFYVTNEKSSVDVGRPNEPSHVLTESPNTALICAFTGRPCKTKSVFVTWQDEATNETAYEVRNTNLEQIKRLPANTTQFQWSGIPRTDKNCFQVRAVNDQGASDWTPVGTAVACA